MILLSKYFLSHDRPVYTQDFLFSWSSCLTVPSQMILLSEYFLSHDRPVYIQDFPFTWSSCLCPRLSFQLIVMSVPSQLIVMSKCFNWSPSFSNTILQNVNLQFFTTLKANHCFLLTRYLTHLFDCVLRLHIIALEDFCLITVTFLFTSTQTATVYWHD